MKEKERIRKKELELESEHFAFKLLIELIEYFYLFSS